MACCGSRRERQARVSALVLRGGYYTLLSCVDVADVKVSWPFPPPPVPTTPSIGEEAAFQQKDSQHEEWPCLSVQESLKKGFVLGRKGKGSIRNRARAMMKERARKGELPGQDSKEIKGLHVHGDARHSGPRHCPHTHARILGTHATETFVKQIKGYFMGCCGQKQTHYIAKLGKG